MCRRMWGAWRPRRRWRRSRRTRRRGRRTWRRRCWGSTSSSSGSAGGGGVAAAAEVERVATGREGGRAYVARAVLGFNEQLEGVCELGVVLLIGGLMAWRYVPGEAWWFVPVLFLVIRPAAVLVGLL